MTLKEFLQQKSYCTPYTSDDLAEAFELGKRAILEKIKDKMIGIPINGACKSVLTEDMLKEIENEA